MADAAVPTVEKVPERVQQRSPLRPLPNGLGFAGLSGSRIAVDSLTFLDVPENISDDEERSYFREDQEDSTAHNLKASDVIGKTAEGETKEGKDSVAASQDVTPSPRVSEASGKAAESENKAAKDAVAKKPKQPAGPPPAHLLKQPAGPPPAHLLKPKEEVAAQKEIPGLKLVPPRPIGQRPPTLGLVNVPTRPSFATGTTTVGQNAATQQFVAPEPKVLPPVAAGSAVDMLKSVGRPRGPAASPSTPGAVGFPPGPAVAPSAPGAAPAPGLAPAGTTPAKGFVLPGQAPAATAQQQAATRQPASASVQQQAAAQQQATVQAAAQQQAAAAIQQAALNQQQQAAALQQQQAHTLQQQAMQAALMGQPGANALAAHAAMLQARAAAQVAMLQANAQQVYAAQAVYAQQVAAQQQQKQPQPPPPQQLPQPPPPSQQPSQTPPPPASTSTSATAPPGASAASASGRTSTGKAMAAYADHELQNFVKRLRLSKETEEALKSLDPETMLSIMVEQKPQGSDSTPSGGEKKLQEEGKETNADGGEDVVVMARVRRAKLDAEDRAAAAAKAQPPAGSSATPPNVSGVVTAQVAQERFAKMMEESAKSGKPAVPGSGSVASNAAPSNDGGSANENDPEFWRLLGGDAKEDDPDGTLALIKRFVSENGLTIAVERRLKELPKLVARQVMDRPGTPPFQVKSSYRDPNAEVIRRIDLAASPKLSKEAKEIDVKIQEKISSKAHSITFAQEVVGFIGKYNLSKDLERGLMMLETVQAREVIKSNLGSLDDKSKEEFVLAKIKKHDKQAYGYISAFKAATSTSKKADKDKQADKDDKKIDDKKKRTPEPRKRSRSRSKRKKSRSRSKRKRSREQHRKSKSLRRRRSRSRRSRSRKSRGRKSRSRKSRSVKRKDRSRSRKKKDRSRSRSRSKSGKRNRRGKSHKRRNSSSSTANKKKRKRDSTSKSRSLSKKRKAAKSKSTEPQAQTTKTADELRAMATKTVDELRAIAQGTGIPNYRDLLRRLYEEHNPEKLGTVDTLMEKYFGQEAEMYQRVCRKYGVAPAFDGGPHRKLEECNAGVEAFSTTDGLDEDAPQAPAIEDIDKSHVENKALSDDGADDGAVETQSVPPNTSTNIVLAGQAQTEDERAVWEWLRGLDNGHGALCRYFDVLRQEFDADFAQIAAAKLPTPISPGSLGSIDPSFFEVLGVTSAGHRLLLAKGILALPS